MKNCELSIIKGYEKLWTVPDDMSMNYLRKSYVDYEASEYDIIIFLMLSLMKIINFAKVIYGTAGDEITNYIENVIAEILVYCILYL